MLYNCHYSLDIDSEWDKLPWGKIDLRISLIQNKIYQAAKKYNKSTIYKLQQYLLNSNEAKLISIKYIISAINKYYHSSSQRLYVKVNQINKIYLLRSLFNLDHLYKDNLYIIMQKIKQHLIYLCLQPEWDAKLDLKYNNNYKINLYKAITLIKQSQINISIKSNQVYNYDNYLINYPFNTKYILTKCISTKLQSSNYINQSINYWLSNRYFLDSIDLDKNIFDNTYKYLYNLQHLLLSVLIVGYNWNTFYIKVAQKINVHQSSNNIKKLQNLNYVKNNFDYNLWEVFYKVILYLTPKHLISNIISEFIYKKIKYIMYQKNSLNKLKANKSLTLEKVLYYIQDILKNIYQYLLSLISIDKLDIIYSTINKMIYFWSKRSLVINSQSKYLRNNYLNIYNMKYKIMYNQLIIK